MPVYVSKKPKRRKTNNCFPLRGLSVNLEAIDRGLFYKQEKRVEELEFRSVEPSKISILAIAVTVIYIVLGTSCNINFPEYNRNTSVCLVMQPFTTITRILNRKTREENSPCFVS